MSSMNKSCEKNNNST